MADERKLFDQRIHDAYEAVEPSPEVQERMLANLLAAQGNERRQAGAERTQTAPAPAIGTTSRRAQSETSPRPATSGHRRSGGRHTVRKTVAPRRRSPWRVVLPLAAVLALVAVVVRVTGLNHGTSRPDAIIATSSEKSSEPEAQAVSEDAVVADEPTVESNALEMEAPLAEGADMDAGAAGEFSETERMVDVCPRIRLEDGTLLTALRDGISVDEVDAGRVGELLGRGTAAAFDAPADESGVSCEVFRLLDEADAFAVRYEGEETFWRCTRLA